MFDPPTRDLLGQRFEVLRCSNLGELGARRCSNLSMSRTLTLCGACSSRSHIVTLVKSAMGETMTTLANETTAAWVIYARDRSNWKYRRHLREKLLFLSPSTPFQTHDRHGFREFRRVFFFATKRSAQTGAVGISGRQKVETRVCRQSEAV